MGTYLYQLMESQIRIRTRTLLIVFGRILTVSDHTLDSPLCHAQQISVQLFRNKLGPNKQHPSEQCPSTKCPSMRHPRQQCISEQCSDKQHPNKQHPGLMSHMILCLDRSCTTKPRPRRKRYRPCCQHHTPEITSISCKACAKATISPPAS
jgi:hypothetical protein